MAKAGLRLQNSCISLACAREGRSGCGSRGAVQPALRPYLIRSFPFLLLDCSPGRERLLIVSTALLQCYKRQILGLDVLRTIA